MIDQLSLRAISLDIHTPSQWGHQSEHLVDAGRQVWQLHQLGYIEGIPVLVKDGCFEEKICFFLDTTHPKRIEG